MHSSLYSVPSLPPTPAPNIVFLPHIYHELLLKDITKKSPMFCLKDGFGGLVFFFLRLNKVAILASCVVQTLH